MNTEIVNVRVPEAIMRCLEREQRGGFLRKHPKFGRLLVGLLRQTLYHTKACPVSLGIAKLKPEHRDSIDRFLVQCISSGVRPCDLLPKTATTADLLALAKSKETES